MGPVAQCLFSRNPSQCRRIPSRMAVAPFLEASALGRWHLPLELQAEDSAKGYSPAGKLANVWLCLH